MCNKKDGDFLFVHLPKKIYTSKVFIRLSVVSDFPALFWDSHPEVHHFLMKTYILKTGLQISALEETSV